MVNVVRLIRYGLVMFLCCALMAWAGTASAIAQGCIQWHLLSDEGPLPRVGHAMVYDSIRGVSVMFGGQDINNQLSGETWEWDGIAWSLRATGGPSPRMNHAMAFDSARGVTVLFAGRDQFGWWPAPDRETWEWDGSAWSHRSSTGPWQREHHAMAYDSARGVTVLFGGRDRDASFIDLWEWDGNSWAIRCDGCGLPHREGHTMSFDSLREVTVLFGGYPSLGYTYEWNGNHMTMCATTGPSPRYEHAMAYDEARGLTVLFGGGATEGGDRYDDTWEWNGNTWVLREVSGPSSCWQHAMVYDSLLGTTLLFGGLSTNLTSDIWGLYVAPSVLADMNCDCHIDGPDIDAFVLALVSPLDYAVVFPTCNIMNADCNHDGSINSLDIDPFFALLTGLAP